MPPPPLDYRSRQADKPASRPPIDIEPLLRRLAGFVILSLALIALLAWSSHEYSRHRYLSRYDPAVLIGLTPTQVKTLLGPPRSENEHNLFYQRGMDPDATLYLSQGRVTRVEHYKYK